MFYSIKKIHAFLRTEKHKLCLVSPLILDNLPYEQSKISTRILQICEHIFYI